MSSVDGPGDGGTMYSKPCLGCRKRKVKCDKTRPCSNCARSKQLCTYESFDTGFSDSPSTNLPSNGDVHERLARLEALMETMMVRDRVSGASTSANSPQGDAGLSVIPSAPLYQELPPLHEKLSVAKPGAPVGQILFQDGHSAYFDSDFWGGLIPEIEDPRILFDPSGESSAPSRWMSEVAIGLNPTTSMVDLSAFHPTIEQSNILCKLFFECVNPFIMVLHQSHFGKELRQYRRGDFPFPREFEGLLFSVYLLAVNSVGSEVVERMFSTSKFDMVSQFKNAAQLALANVNVHKTDKITTFQAVIHYLTFLFQQNLYQDAIPLLGVAVRLAQTFGIHRDPGHFPFSPWVCSLRRRGWNHIYCLDALALSSYGTESCLPVTSDAAPPLNANESDWHASRFGKPASVPSDVSGFKDMTFAIVNRAISSLVLNLSRVDADDFDARRRLIHQTEQNLYNRFLNHTDRSDPSQTVVVALVEVRLSNLRLAISHRQYGRGRAKSHTTERYQNFLSAINMLEAIQYHCQTFATHNWDWVFRTVVPWLPTAIILTQMTQEIRKSDIDRAQRNIDIVFQRYSEPSNPLTTTPMWKLLVQLRQQLQGDWPISSTSNSSLTSLQSGRFESSGASALAFPDDPMLGFNQGVPSGNQFMFDDSLSYQDLQDLPWLNTQMPY